MTATGLATALRTPDLVVVEEVTSTLDILHALAAEGAPAGTAVLADVQTRGRGRQGRTWHSPRGGGIWLGYLVRPGSVGAASLLAVRAGLAATEALAAVGVTAHLKWPNDILVGDRKVAGILCETRWDGPRPAWTAVGLGMNVNGPLPASIGPGAGAVSEFAPVTRIGVLERLLPHLHAVPDMPTLSAHEIEMWQARDWLAGRRLREPAAGVARGIEADGALRIETDGAVRRALTGHVVLA